MYPRMSDVHAEKDVSETLESKQKDNSQYILATASLAGEMWSSFVLVSINEEQRDVPHIARALLLFSVSVRGTGTV